MNIQISQIKRWDDLGCRYFRKRGVIGGHADYPIESDQVVYPAAGLKENLEIFVMGFMLYEINRGVDLNCCPWRHSERNQSVKWVASFFKVPAVQNILYFAV